MSKKIKLSEAAVDDKNLPSNYYDLMQKYMGVFGQQLGLDKFRNFVEKDNQNQGDSSQAPAAAKPNTGALAWSQPPATEDGASSYKGYNRLGDFCRGGDTVWFGGEADKARIQSQLSAVNDVMLSRGAGPLKEQLTIPVATGETESGDTSVNKNNDGSSTDPAPRSQGPSASGASSQKKESPGVRIVREEIKNGFVVPLDDTVDFATNDQIRLALMGTDYKKPCMEYYRSGAGAGVIASSLFLGMFLYSHPFTNAAVRPFHTWSKLKTILAANDGALGKTLKEVLGRAAKAFLAVDSVKTSGSATARAIKEILRIVTAPKMNGFGNILKYTTIAAWKGKNTILTVFMIAAFVYWATKDRTDSEGKKQLSEWDPSLWRQMADPVNQLALRIMGTVESWEIAATDWMQSGLPDRCKTTGAWATQMVIGAYAISGVRFVASMAGGVSGVRKFDADDLARLAEDLEIHRLITLRNEIISEITPLAEKVGTSAGRRAATAVGLAESGRLIPDELMDDFLRICFQVTDPEKRIDDLVELMKKSTPGKNSTDELLRKEATELATAVTGKMEEAYTASKAKIATQLENGAIRLDDLDSRATQAIGRTGEHVLEEVIQAQRYMDPKGAGFAEEAYETGAQHSRRRAHLNRNTARSTEELFTGADGRPLGTVVDDADAAAARARGEMIVYEGDLARRADAFEDSVAAARAADEGTIGLDELGDVAEKAARERNEALDALLSRAHRSVDDGGLARGEFLQLLDQTARHSSEKLVKLVGGKIDVQQADNLIDFFGVVVKSDENIDIFMKALRQGDGYWKNPKTNTWFHGEKEVGEDNLFQLAFGGTKKGTGAAAQFDLNDVVTSVKQNLARLGDESGGSLIANPRFNELIADSANKVARVYEKVDPGFMRYSGGFNFHQWTLISIGTLSVLYAIHGMWVERASVRVSEFYDDIQDQDNLNAIADVLKAQAGTDGAIGEQDAQMMRKMLMVLNPDDQDSKAVYARLYDHYIFVRPVDVFVNKVLDEWEKFVDSVSNPTAAQYGLNETEIKGFGMKLRNMLLDLRCQRGNIVFKMDNDDVRTEKEARPGDQHFEWDKFFSQKMSTNLRDAFLVPQAVLKADAEEKMDQDELASQKLLSQTWWPLLIRILILNAEIPERFWDLVHKGENSRNYIKFIKLHKNPEKLEAYIRDKQGLDPEDPIDSDLLERYKASIKNKYESFREDFGIQLWNNYVFIYNNGARDKIVDSQGKPIMPGINCKKRGDADEYAYGSGLCAPFVVDGANVIQIDKNIAKFRKNLAQADAVYRKNRNANRDLGNRFYDAMETLTSEEGSFMGINQIFGREILTPSGISRKDRRARAKKNAFAPLNPMQERPPPPQKEGNQRTTLYGKTQLEKMVSQVLREQFSSGYADYPYSSQRGEEEEPAQDYLEDWKALEMAIAQDKTRESAIQLAKILINDLELFNDILDLTGQNQSIGSEILRKLDQVDNKSKKT